MRDTAIILAHASAPGWSDRALIRAAGSGCLALLGSVIQDPLAASRGSRPCRLDMGDGLCLACLVNTYAAPRSYTGEDAFELILPGNPLLVDRVMQRLLSMGHGDARLATPGEFSARAFLAGRLELVQAEGIAALIAARSTAQAAAARRLLEGAEGRSFRQWYEELISLLALVEAGIDFTDQEDVVAISPQELERRLGVVACEVQGMIGAVRVRVLGARPVVALVGPPNAGKSTLFNTLLGRPRSVASPVAGTTRDVLREPLDLSRDVPGAGVVELLDLPGLEVHEQASPSAAAAQQAARRALAGADVVLYCDPVGTFAPLHTPAGATVIRVRTKADLAAFGPSTADSDLAVCSLDGWSLGPLRRAIADSAIGPSLAMDDAVLIPRHRRALLDAMEAMQGVQGLCAGRGFDPVLAAQGLRQATEALGDLAGRVSPDDVLGRIFSTFCIGK